MLSIKCYSLTLTDKHILLLLAYAPERSKVQAQRIIDYRLGKELHMGRHILPLTQELIDLGLIERTNPGSPSVKGHKHVTTSRGHEVVNEYFDLLKSISEAEPQFGY